MRAAYGLLSFYCYCAKTRSVKLANYWRSTIDVVQKKGSINRGANSYTSQCKTLGELFESSIRRQCHLRFALVVSGVTLAITLVTSRFKSTGSQPW